MLTPIGKLRYSHGADRLELVQTPRVQGHGPQQDSLHFRCLLQVGSQVPTLQPTGYKSVCVCRGLTCPPQVQ